jgi:hypothetical protein
MFDNDLYDPDASNFLWSRVCIIDTRPSAARGACHVGLAVAMWGPGVVGIRGLRLEVHFSEHPQGSLSVYFLFSYSVLHASRFGVAGGSGFEAEGFERQPLAKQSTDSPFSVSGFVVGASCFEV